MTPSSIKREATNADILKVLQNASPEFLNNTAGIYFAGDENGIGEGHFTIDLSEFNAKEEDLDGDTIANEGDPEFRLGKFHGIE